MIARKYIDTSSATIAAMRDYENMQAIIDNTPDSIQEVSGRMTAPRSAQVTGMPSAFNPGAGQEQLADLIDKMDILQDRYHIAVDYMSWFTPAWERLEEQEQQILSEIYMSNQFRNGARYRLANSLNYTERHVDRLRAKALQKMQTLLYG